MKLHVVKTVAEYASLGLYGLCALAFLIFMLNLAVSSQRNGAKYTLAGILLAPIWPLFLIVALVRQKISKNVTSG